MEISLRWSVFVVFVHNHENSASPLVNLEKAKMIHDLWALRSLFHSAEGSDLASTIPPPCKPVWLLHLCADHQVVTETQHHGEGVNLYLA